MSVRTLLAGLLAAWAFAASAQAPAHLGRYQSSPQDTEAILQLARDFRAAIMAKDGARLSSLLLHPKILFSSPGSPAAVRKRRQGGGDSGFDGVDAAGAAGFVDFVSTSKEPIDETFHNLRLTQDGHVAWLLFDFEFFEGGRIVNHGIEVWQLLKTADERWKILSVVWTSHGTP